MAVWRVSIDEQLKCRGPDSFHAGESEARARDYISLKMISLIGSITILYLSIPTSLAIHIKNDLLMK